MAEGDDSRERRGLRISGRVQGVGFRWFTRTNAGDLGLTGSVRNCPDGSVEIRAAGRREDLDRLEERLRRGPPAARVDRVEPIDSSLPVPDDDFIISR